MTRAPKSGFPPIARHDARVLILGTMPGEESLRQNQYYAHARNAFWPIIGALYELVPEASYAERRAALLDHHIALWDVIARCERHGSLDTAIAPGTIVVNDFAGFLAAHPAIRAIFFNGARAEAEFCRRVAPALPPALGPYRYTRLPSTSPAMAQFDFAQKLAAWRAIRVRDGE